MSEYIAKSIVDALGIPKKFISGFSRAASSNKFTRLIGPYTAAYYAPDPLNFVFTGNGIWTAVLPEDIELQVYPFRKKFHLIRSSDAGAGEPNLGDEDPEVWYDFWRLADPENKAVTKFELEAI